MMGTDSAEVQECSTSRSSLLKMLSSTAHWNRELPEMGGEGGKGGEKLRRGRER
jgi:hypothetical protein